MKDRDTRYFDPLTGSGMALPEYGMRFWVHEAGHMLLDSDWNHTSVRSPFWRAYYNQMTGAAIRLGGKRISLGPRRVALIPPNCVFDCIPKSDVPHTWIHFSTESPFIPLAHRVLTVDDGEIQLWMRVGQLAGLPGKSTALFHLARACLHMAWSHLPAGEALEPGQKLRRWLSLIQSRIASPPSIDEMAAHMAMSRRSFLRWFREETQRSPADYAIDVRIRDACVRLRYSGDSIDAIAEATGFADRHHFSRVFKARAGISPAAWRREPHPSKAIVKTVDLLLS